jgi:hypothetical protein
MENLNRAALRPVECARLVRLGRPDGDGGYVVPDDAVRSARHLLSLGLSDEWSFDEDFLRANPDAKLIGVDHTVGPLFFVGRFCSSLVKLLFYALTFNRSKLRKWRRRLDASIRYFSFFRPPHRHIMKKVAAAGGASSVSVDALLALAQPAGRHDVFLKMDIEGSEYEVIPAVAAGRERISCIAAEFHDLDREKVRFNEALRQLSEHFAVVHVHGNNCRPYDPDIGFPTVVEITLLNKALLEGNPRPRKDRYPLPGLDAANNPGKPDYALSFD